MSGSQTGNPPDGNLNWSDLSQQQIIQRAFQETTDTLRVDLAAIESGIVIPVTQGALSVLGSFNIPYTSISNSAPYTITAGFIKAVQQFLISDTTGQVDILAWNTTIMYTNPGCEHQVGALIPPSTPVTIQSNDVSNPVAGSFIITFLG